MPRTLSFIETTSLLEIGGRAYGLWHYQLRWSMPTDPASHTVVAGESLSSIAAKFLGDGRRWPEIFHLNKALITNPNLIFPGQQLTLPSGVGLESQVGLGLSAQIDIRNPSSFPDVHQLGSMHLVTLQGADVQYITTGLTQAHGNALDFYLVAPSAVNASTPVILATKDDLATGWHDLAFDTGNVQLPLTSNTLGHILPGPAVVAGGKAETPPQSDSTADGPLDSNAKVKNVLPYASEPFGVYQALLGWRSNLSHERMAAATTNRFLAATHLMGSAVDMSPKAPIGTPVLRVAIDRTGTAVGAQIAERMSGVDNHHALRSTLSNAHDSALSLVTNNVIAGLTAKGASTAASFTRSSATTALPTSDSPTSMLKQIQTEAATATLLRYLGEQDPAVVTAMFRPTLASWERVIGSSAFFVADTPARDAFLSPIGILHLFREFFFELGTFLGPPVGHVWISPGGSVELMEVNTRKQLVERTIEQSTETIQKSDTSQTQQDELSDAVKTENANDTKLGVTATASGGVASVFQASGSASLNLDISRKEAQEQTHKQMREQSTKLSSEVRQNYKTTFRTVTETTDTSSRRYVLQNTTDRLVSYELSRKMRKITVQVQDLGRQLCWQLYIDNPGDSLGLGEFVHEAMKLTDPSSKLPDTQPPPGPITKTFSNLVPFIDKTSHDSNPDVPYTPEDADGRPDQGINKVVSGHNSIIQFEFEFEAPAPPSDYHLTGIESITFKGEAAATKDGISDPNPNPATNRFKFRLTKAHFHNQPSIPFDVVLIYTPTQNAIDKVNKANNDAKIVYNDEVARLKEQKFFETLRARLKLVGMVKPRPQDDLREEERIIIYRAIISQLYGRESGWSSEDYHVASEMIRYLFDIDTMLYFVAPDWWRPRSQTLVSKNDKGELQPTILSEQSTTRLTPGSFKTTGIPGITSDYLITEETAPAPLGASLGWLIQFDGDAHRNAFLNSPWVKAVLPIRAGRERVALAWLQSREVADTDGLNEIYPFDATQDPPEYKGLTIETVLLKIADQIAEEHRKSLTPLPVDKTGINPELALPTEMVFAHGFDPLEGGINFGAGPFEIFSQWIEVLPTDQIVATEYNLKGL